MKHWLKGLLTSTEYHKELDLKIKVRGDAILDEEVLAECGAKEVFFLEMLDMGGGGVGGVVSQHSLHHRTPPTPGVPVHPPLRFQR